MDFFFIVIIAVSLSMDAFAVSISCGFMVPSPKRWNALKIAFSFGFFQTLMPIIGWLTGRSFARYIEKFDHWIAFIILCIIGIRMIYNAVNLDDCKAVADPTNPKTLLMLSVATSIDALAVGVTFAFLNTGILVPVLLIGIITFGISLLGMLIGHKLGYYLGKRFEIIGGIILIGIGIKILIEHIYF